MRKFLAVVKHEYRKVVLKWSFLIGTLLLPVLAGLFPAVMLLIFSLNGEPTRIVVVDASQRIGQRIRQNLSAEAISERAKRAAAEALKDLNASQEDRLKRGSEQLSSEFAFVDYDAKIDEAIKKGGNLTAHIREINREYAATQIMKPNSGW